MCEFGSLTWQIIFLNIFAKMPNKYFSLYQCLSDFFLWRKEEIFNPKYSEKNLNLNLQIDVCNYCPAMGIFA